MNVQNTIVVNSNLGGLSFYEDATGKYVVGADSVPKKLVRPELKIIKVGYEGHGDDWDHWYLFDIVIDVSECSKITLGGITSPSNWAYIMVRIKKDGSTVFDGYGNNYDNGISNNKIITACNTSYVVSDASTFTIVLGQHYGNQISWINNITIE